MSKDKLYIPNKCKVGFNVRTDTYTGKLGYIIYHDGKVWRKEGSWNSWKQEYIDPIEYDKLKQESFNKTVEQHTKQYNEYKDKPKPQYDYTWELVNKHSTLKDYLKYCRCNDYKSYSFYVGKKVADTSINPVEFENIPIEGFVLNKKVGGHKSDWNFRQAYCRVYDPRGWEFEITVPNLLFILECSNSIKGKGLEGEFIYAWEGKDLVLLPCSSSNYQSSIEYTKLQAKSISIKELKEGYSYLNKDGEELIYLGKLPIVRDKKDGEEEYKVGEGYYRNYTRTRTKYKKVVVKEHIFYGKSTSRWSSDEQYRYNFMSNIPTIKTLASSVISEEYSNLVENYYKLFKTKIDE